MDETLRAKILDVLNAHHIMTLATIRPDGYPQATTVNYVNDNLTIYFATDPASQKSANIQLNSKVSIAIASETENAYKLHGLSLSGNANRVGERKRAQELCLRLFKKLPQVKRLAPEDPDDLAVYAITPLAISLVDYESGYGKTYLLKL